MVGLVYILVSCIDWEVVVQDKPTPPDPFSPEENYLSFLNSPDLTQTHFYMFPTQPDLTTAHGGLKHSIGLLCLAWSMIKCRNNLADTFSVDVFIPAKLRKYNTLGRYE